MMMEQKIDSRIVCGKEIANVMKHKVKNEVKIFSKILKRKPQIVSLIVGENRESKLYLKLRTKACEEVGIQAIQQEFSKNIKEKELINEIIKLNKSPQVDGILVQLPLPNQLSSYNILSRILPEKDVEGFTNKYGPIDE
jgi:methylenetetrahydrofolate dehydrogenase (NADP+) / methenyltetrahydrofolate cyclohydrolase